MAPHRLTVRLDDEAAAWVEQMQEQHDRSRAWVIREAVDLARGDPSAFGGAEGTGAHRGGPHRDGAEGTADLRERVDELEEENDKLRSKIADLRVELAKRDGKVPAGGGDE